MEISEVLNSIFEKIRNVGGVELSFGKAQTLNDLTIIPVARVAFGFGGGSGSGGKKKKKAKVHTKVRKAVNTRAEGFISDNCIR